MTLATSNDSCHGSTLSASGGTCTITVTLTSYGVGSATLELINSSGAILGYVPISVNNPQPISPSGGGGGGGCSAITNGNDYSLILILCVLSILYYFKRKCIKK